MISILFLLLISQIQARVCKVIDLQFGTDRKFNDPTIYNATNCPCWSRDCVIDFSDLQCGTRITNISITVPEFYMPTKQCKIPPTFIFNSTTTIETLYMGVAKIMVVEKSFVSIQKLLVEENSSIEFVNVENTILINRISTLETDDIYNSTFETQALIHIIDSHLTIVHMNPLIGLNMTRSGIHFNAEQRRLNSLIHMRESLLYYESALEIENSTIMIYRTQNTDWSSIYVNEYIYVTTLNIIFNPEGNSYYDNYHCNQQYCTPFITNTPGHDITLRKEAQFTVMYDNGVGETEVIVSERSIDICYERTQDCSILERYGPWFIFGIFLILLLPFLLIPIAIWISQIGCSKDYYQNFGV